MPNSTAYRLIAVLVQDGLLHRNADIGKYSVGHALYAMGSLYLSSTDIVKAASSVIKTLNELTGETINVGMLDSSNLVIVMTEEAKGALKIATHAGTVVPAYASAMGKVLLSELTEEEIDRLYPGESLKPSTKKTIVTKKQLKLELEQIKRTSIAYSREESFEGIEAIASLIRDASSKALAATSIAVPVFRMNEVIRRQLATLIVMGSNLISYQIGYKAMPSPIHDVKEIISWWGTERMDWAS